MVPKYYYFLMPERIGIFDKEGNLKEDEIKMKLENYFNEEIENLMQLNF